MKTLKKTIVGVAVTSMALMFATGADASSGTANCGPTLVVQTSSTGSGNHHHTLGAGGVFDQNVGPNVATVNHRWTAHSGNWTTNLPGSAGCVS